MKACLVEVNFHIFCINVETLTSVSIHFIEVQNPLSHTQQNKKETKGCD